MLTGSVQVKKGNCYAVLNVYEGGRRRPKWISLKMKAKGNKRRARAELAKLISSYEHTGSRDMTLKNLFTLFLKKKSYEVTPETLRTYEGLSRRILSRLDGKLSALSRERVAGYYAALTASGKSANTVAHYHVFLSQAFKYAMEQGYVRHSPTAGIALPKRNKTPRKRFLCEREVGILLTKTRGERIYPCVLLAVGLGLRRSEALGLKWSAVDFENARVTVRHKIVEQRFSDGVRLIGRDGLKNTSSYRTLPLSPRMLSELNFIKSASHGEYVCEGAWGLPRPSYVSARFSRVAAGCGLSPLRFHDLRHTCASLMLAGGVPMKAIQEWLGHSAYSTTADIYAHLDASAKVSAAAELSRRVFGEC